jgi:quercetin dioxygenase-like cupin family protein
MALPHLQSEQPADLSPFGITLSHEKTVALFKSKNLEVIRLVLQTGQSFPPHEVDGDITIQCIEGRLEIMLRSGSVHLEPNHLVYLSGRTRHGVTAIIPSSALVTIALLNDKDLDLRH